MHPSCCSKSCIVAVVGEMLEVEVDCREQKEMKYDEVKEQEKSFCLLGTLEVVESQISLEGSFHQEEASSEEEVHQLRQN